MPTYNGTSITTGTLYEDGSITVKSGYPPNIDKIKVNNASVVSSRKKVKIFYGEPQLEVDKPIVNNASVVSSRCKQKTVVANNQLEAVAVTVNNLTVVGSRQKKVIIIP